MPRERLTKHGEMYEMAKIWIIILTFIIYQLLTTSQSSLPDLYNDVKPSVVLVLANDSHDSISCKGTGFFINKAGDIITNLHVINESRKANVITADGEMYGTTSHHRIQSQKLDLRKFSV